MKQRKFLAVLLIAIMLLSSLLFSPDPARVYAADEPVIAVGTVSGFPGDTVEIPVMIENNPGVTLINSRVWVDEAVGSVKNSYSNPKGDNPLGACTFLGSQQDGSNPCTMYWESGLEDLTGDGIIGYVEVVIRSDVEPGKYSVWVAEDSFEAYNLAFSSVSFRLEAGTVTVLAPPCQTHSWGEWEVIREATCDEPGEQSHACVICGVTEAEEIEALGHAFTAYTSNQDATCVEDGTETSICDRCEETDTRTDTGSREDAGHSFPESYISDGNATCTADGTQSRTCLLCGETETIADPGSALGHSWDEGKVTKEPTEDTEGERTYTCTACGETRTESIPRTEHPHSYVAVEVEPNCTEMGFTRYTCETCGYTYTEWSADPLGHNYANGVCTRCGEADPSFEPENPFGDVKETDYFFEPVLWAVEQGITVGTSANTFSPEAACTRGQIVTFLWRANGSPEPERNENPFRDVAETDYYYKAVLWAVEQGITMGTSAGEFSPNAPCTRAQVATFLWRSVGSPEPENEKNPFMDVAESEYFYQPVLWAVENGVTMGTGDGKFSPQSQCTRSQIVTFLYRALI